eukprot:gene19212-biopygen32177
MMYRHTGARCSSVHNLMGWNELGANDANENARDARGQAVHDRFLVAPAEDGGGESALRWLVIEEAGALSPDVFQRLERDLRKHCPAGFPRSTEAQTGMRSFAGLNVIMVGDFYQMDPVDKQYFWRENACAGTQVGIDLLLDEFGGRNLIELTDQCRVLDAAFQREKCDHVRSRARVFATARRRRLYWSIAQDWLSVVVKFDGFPDPIPIGRSAKKFTLGSAKSSTGVRRLQIPLLPAYGLTAHRAQGATLPSALVDLQGMSGAFGDASATYVALSRVRRLQD